MNKSISNILEIYRLVAHQNCTPVEAARKVGERSNTLYSDLMSSCAKDLNISPEKFDTFLESKDNFNFKNFLFRRFPEEQDQIIQFFNSFEDTSHIPILDFTKILKKSPPLGKKSISDQILSSSLKDSFLDWIARPDIPQDVKDELKKWMNKIN